MRKEQITEIQDLLDRFRPTVEWGQSDNLSKDFLRLAEERKVGEIEDRLWELNLDYIADLEFWAVEETVKDVLDIDKVDPDLLREIMEQVYVSVDLGINQLLSQENIRFRLTLYSNYDCINSHWFESQGGYYYTDNYFGHIVDLMCFDPAKLKRSMEGQGIPTEGYWPHKTGREPLIDEDEFIREIVNSCSPVNLWVILGQLPLDEWIDCRNPTEVHFPQGALCGLFSSFHGGGSLIECKLPPGTSFKLGQCGETEYDRLELVSDRFTGYSVNEVFQCTDEIFYPAEVK